MNIGTNNIRTKPDSKYRLILIAAKRSKQIQMGSAQKITTTTHSSNKPTRIALEEIKQDLIPFEILPIRLQKLK